MNEEMPWSSVFLGKVWKLFWRHKSQPHSITEGRKVQKKPPISYHGCRLPEHWCKRTGIPGGVYRTDYTNIQTYRYFTDIIRRLI